MRFGRRLGVPRRRLRGLNVIGDRHGHAGPPLDARRFPVSAAWSLSVFGWLDVVGNGPPDRVQAVGPLETGRALIGRDVCPDAGPALPPLFLLLLLLLLLRALPAKHRHARFLLLWLLQVAFRLARDGSEKPLTLVAIPFDGLLDEDLVIGQSSCFLMMLCLARARASGMATWWGTASGGRFPLGR
jgi:hypothetical protein